MTLASPDISEPSDRTFLAINFILFLVKSNLRFTFLDMVRALFPPIFPPFYLSLMTSEFSKDWTRDWNFFLPHRIQAGKHGQREDFSSATEHHRLCEPDGD